MAYSDQQLQQIAKAAEMLEQMDYYQVLKLTLNASPQDIKGSFFKQSRVWHPDRFYRRVPDETYKQVMVVYKRISEAYAILRDDKLRHLYNQRIQGPDRAKYLRYDRAAEEARERAKKDEDVAKTEPGKRYAKLAFTAIKQRNFASAEINFKLAMSMEQDNTDLKLAYLRARRDFKQKLSEEEQAFLAEHGE